MATPRSARLEWVPTLVKINYAVCFGNYWHAVPCQDTDGYNTLHP